MLTSFTSSDGADLKVTLAARQPELTFVVNGQVLAVTVLDAPAGSFALRLGGRVLQGWRLVQGNDTYLRIAGRTFALHRSDLPGEGGSGGAAGNDILSDMPGTVVAIHVEAGAEVQEGDRLLTIESMKMQMTVSSPRTGRIATVHVGGNASFERGVPLVSFMPAADGKQG